MYNVIVFIFFMNLSSVTMLDRKSSWHRSNNGMSSSYAILTWEKIVIAEMAKLGKRTALKMLYPARGLRVRLPFSVQIFSLTISKIVIMFISKKTMRKKDFACLKAEKPNYKAFRAPKENARHKFQTLFKTPRGWFLSMMQDKKRVIGEISVPAAQEWLDECHFKYETGW